MRGSNGVFSPQERKTALWALLMAGLIAAMGMVIQQWGQPSVGPGGAESYMTAPPPGVVDAQPVLDVGQPLG
jgi:hypothetical protein